MDGNQCKTKENIHNNKRKLRITREKKIYNISTEISKLSGDLDLYGDSWEVVWWSFHFDHFFYWVYGISLNETKYHNPFYQGHQRIVSVNVNYLFTSNFRDVLNLRPGVFGLIKNVVSGTEKRSAKIFGKEIRPKVFGKWTEMP